MNVPISGVAGSSWAYSSPRLHTSIGPSPRGVNTGTRSNFMIHLAMQRSFRLGRQTQGGPHTNTPYPDSSLFDGNPSTFQLPALPNLLETVYRKSQKPSSTASLALLNKALTQPCCAAVCHDSPSRPLTASHYKPVTALASTRETWKRLLKGNPSNFRARCLGTRGR